jgi:hypothetical protein
MSCRQLFMEQLNCFLTPHFFVFLSFCLSRGYCQLSPQQGCPSCHNMACCQVADGVDGLQGWSVTVNILNKQSQTANKDRSSTWGGGGQQLSTMNIYYGVSYRASYLATSSEVHRLREFNVNHTVVPKHMYMFTIVYYDCMW